MTILASSFRRDRATLLLYALLAYYAYLQAVISPAMNYVTDELGLTYTVRGLHITAFAAGMIAAGLTGERAARRFGRVRALWGGCAGMALGALLLAVGRAAPVTILATFLMGFVGTFALVMIQALLSDRHGSLRAIAFTESNVAAIVLATCAPLAVGLAASVGITWRVPLLVGVVALGAIWLLGRKLMLDSVPSSQFSVLGSESAAPGTQHSVPSTQHALPRVFWLYWLVAFFSVGVEWSTVFWSGDFLERVVGLPKADATTTMTAFLAAMTIGRAAGSRFARHADSRRLLVISIGLALFGFSIFWLAPEASLNVGGLFLAGLGVANLYPLTLSVTTGLAPALADVASARTTLASGTAIFLAPQVLGSLADQVGIGSALGVTGLLAVGALVAALIGMRAKV